jgi:hypothetical protein
MAGNAKNLMEINTHVIQTQSKYSAGVEGLKVKDFGERNSYSSLFGINGRVLFFRENTASKIKSDAGDLVLDAWQEYKIADKALKGNPFQKVKDEAWGKYTSAKGKEKKNNHPKDNAKL